MGAPKGSGWLYKLKLSLNDFDYAGIASIEAESAQAASGITRTLFPAQEASQERAVRALHRRAQVHSDRAIIYDRRSGLMARLRAFTRILFSGGYRDDPALYHLGRRAAFKDLTLGLTGVRRFVGDE